MVGLGRFFEFILLRTTSIGLFAGRNLDFQWKYDIILYVFN